MNWSFKTYGSQTRPPIVFLHGFMGTYIDWEFLQEAFAKDYFCVFPDLPGHGQNGQGLPDQPLTMRWLAAGLARTLANLGLSSAHLVGYSLGGRVALYFTVNYPNLVKSLILESASPGLEGREARRQRRLVDNQRAADILNDGLEQFVDEWYEMPLFASLHRNPGLVNSLKNRRKQNDPQAMARVVAELSPGRQPSVWGKLGNIQAPSLLLAGQFDLQYTATVQHMAAAMPHARQQITPGAGHNVHLENPEAYIQTIKTFLDSVAFLA